MATFGPKGSSTGTFAVRSSRAEPTQLLARLVASPAGRRGPTGIKPREASFGAPAAFAKHGCASGARTGVPAGSRAKMA
jgi:hypothetical protein